MTTTITKRADELKRGDVISRFDRPISVVIQAVAPVNAGEVRFLVYDIWAREIITVEVGCSADYVVEAPTLSPAQQHAEELLSLLRECDVDSAREQTDWEHRVSRLLAKIDPPQPPTLEEALGALEAMRSGLNAPGSAARVTEVQNADAILDRARRAKIIP